MFGDPAVNPMDWNAYTLEEIAEIRGGIQMCRDRQPMYHPKPYLTVRNVYDGYLDLSDVRYMEVHDNELSKWLLRPGDLLVLEGNGRKENVGRAAIFNGEIENCVYQNHVFRVRINTSIMLPLFAMTYLNTPQMKDQFFQVARTTAGINSINTSQLKSLKMICPPIESQDKFIGIINKAQELRQRLKDMNTEELATSLAHTAFQ
jgi:type I restriction enzyme S subunit